MYYDDNCCLSPNLFEHNVESIVGYSHKSAVIKFVKLVIEPHVTFLKMYKKFSADL